MGKLRLTVDEFAERVNKATNGRITIIKETYTGTRYKVTAYCNVHKIYFEVNVAYQLINKNSNCPECYKEIIQKQNKSRIVPFVEILKRFQNVYKNIFSYDESSYSGFKKTMKVHCNECGEEFEITPEHHLKYNNGGCPNCSKYIYIKCEQCGKMFKIGRNATHNHNILCKDCYSKKKKLMKYIRRHKTDCCLICGRKLNDNLECNNEFCKHHNIREFKTYIRYFGFDKNKLKTEEVEDEFNRMHNMLEDLYRNKHMTSSELSKMFNYPSPGTLVSKVFRKIGIKIKTLSESISEGIKMNKRKLPSDTKFKTGYHKTWDNKQIYLRSSYEFDFAKILDEQQTLYEVETLRIQYFDTQQQKERIAIPDFYLPETNTIIEVKSSWTFDLQNMIDKRSAYLKLGYNFKLWYEHEFVEIESIIIKDKRAPN